MYMYIDSVDDQLHDLKEIDIIVPPSGRMVADSPAILTDWFGLNVTLKRWKNLLSKTLDSIYRQTHISQYKFSGSRSCAIVYTLQVPTVAYDDVP